MYDKVAEGRHWNWEGFDPRLFSTSIIIRPRGLPIEGDDEVSMHVVSRQCAALQREYRGSLSLP